MKRLIMAMVATAALAGCRMTDGDTAARVRDARDVCEVSANVTRFPARKKVIGFGWDTCSRTAGELADRADQLAALGLDGVGFQIKHRPKEGKVASYNSVVYQAKPFEPLDEFWENTNDIKRLCATKLTDNFVLCSLFFEKRTPFEDEEFWRLACEKIAMFAKIAKIGGAKGILIDTEDYGGSGQFYWHPKDCRHDPKETGRYARMRGRQLMEAVAKEYPDCKVLSTWLLSNQSRKSYQDAYNGQRARAEAEADLFVPFMEGFLEGLGPDMTLTDGDEAGYYWEAARREFFYDYFAMKQLCPKVLDPALSAKYALQVKAGFGLYLDSYTLPEKNGWAKGPLDGSRLRHFELNLRQALEVTDEYVWLWGERYAFADWKGCADKRHVSPTWEEALPGFSATVNFLKNPKCYGESLYRARLAEGAKLENLIRPSAVATNAAGVLAECPKPWRVSQRERKDGYTGKFTQLTTGGQSGGLAVKAEYVFAGSLTLPGMEPEKGAIYRASVWFKTSEGIRPSFKVTHVTQGHPIWNDGGGWMAQGAKHADGNGVSVSAGDPGKDGWREAVIYFRGERFDASVSLSANLGRRMFEGEYAIVSDPA
ncbi:MAG: hypothetical protein PHV28_18110, partial [Kiritimatiellae bacterium]|nr:hypothetical protein [Kiritimatiellia bacterium]